MAQIDASGLQFAFNALEAASVQHDALSVVTPGAYSWVTGSASPFYRITAYSFGENISNPPPTGTINSVYITDDAYTPGLSITGFTASLANMVHTTDAATNQERFWETLLAGATTILLPGLGFQFSMMGDYVSVGTGQVLAGSADNFVGAGTFSTGTLIGDAIFVQAGATLTGGADTFTDTSASFLVGDVGGPENEADSNLGIVNGGADKFSLIDVKYTPDLGVSFVVGDVARNGATGIVNGGADNILLRNINNVSLVIGDVYIDNGESHGGNDTIRLETTIAGRDMIEAGTVVGDVYLFPATNQAIGGSAVLAAGETTGGNDTINLDNVLSDVVSGDFGHVIDRTAVGGNDTITYRGTFALTTPAPPYPITPTTGTVAGDADEVSGTSDFTGGDDAISLVRVRATDIVGDVLTMNAGGRFVGGDDSISILFDRANEVAPTYWVYGDSYLNQANDFTGGGDTIAVNLLGSIGGTVTRLFGDSRTNLPIGSATIRNGDDIIRVTAGASQAAYIYGDALSASNGANLTVVDGDDTLTGGGGNDFIYGDTLSVTNDGTLNYTGGDDILDGRGGNDYIDGGLGNDTAVFSLDRSVHVDLNGIVGSGADPYEAIGQGNDQLVEIENVTGSSQNDVIIGDGGFNILQGMAGADFINGGGGTDTASYAESDAKVTVNLSTGVTSGGHAQGDTLVSIERLTGSAFDDSLVGNNGANLLDGGAGADMLRGLGGDDVYVVDNAGDVVDEAFSGSGGTDTVRASISVDLGNTTQFKGNIEKVALIAGITGLNATGNGLANVVTGNNLGNTLNGGLGNDSLTGGGGADKFLFDTALGAGNIDTITDFALDDTIQLENAIFTALTTTGTLAAGLFKNTDAGAIDASDRIIYNFATGALIYDTNGSAAGGATQFATLSAGLALTNADFVVI